MKHEPHMSAWRRLAVMGLVVGVLSGAAGSAADVASTAGVPASYRSLLSEKPGLIDLEACAEDPAHWQVKDREVRFRSAFESGSCPRYEAWSTGQSAKPDGAYALRLEFKQPVACATVLAYGNAAFQIQAADAAGALQEMIGDAGDSLRVSALAAGSPAMKRLTFTAAQVPGQFQNNFVLGRGNENVDQNLASYAFHLGGVYLFPEALENLAPFATAAADGVGAGKEAERDLISAAGLNDRSPERFWRSRKFAETEGAEAVLTWDRPVTATVVGCLIPWNCVGKMPDRAEFSVSGEGVTVARRGQPDWQPLATINDFNDNMWNGRRLYLARLPEPKTFTALKVRFTAKRGQVEIGELLVLGEVKGQRQSELLAKLLPPPEPPPIRVPYELPGKGVAGWLERLVPARAPTTVAPERFTLVIEDTQGNRIRNLLADAPVTALRGDAVWDGLDEAGKLAAPGNYVVRGLVHEPLRGEYVLSVYTPPGAVPWVTKDRRGGWLSDHCGASTVEFLDGRLWIGAPFAEAGDTIIKTDPDGRKEWGLRWLDLDGARLITSANGKIYVGNAGGWRGKNYAVIEVDPATCRFKRILDLREEAKPGKDSGFGDESFSGLAVSGDQIYLAFRDGNRIDVYDAAAGKKTRELAVPSPRGLILETPDRALVLSGTTLQRCDLRSGTLAPVIRDGLTDPANLTVDNAGNILVADRGANQVLIFSPQGKLARTIGKAGGRKPGLYDPLAFDRPMDVAVDGTGRIWVAEAGLQPKRISVWNADGTLWREFLGPGRYACGGYLDPANRTRFFAEGMEFTLDYERGTSTLKSVISPAPENSFFANNEMSADRTLRVKNNLFLISDRHWCRPLFWFGILRGDVLKPVAAVGGYPWLAKQFGKAHPDVPAGKEKEFTFLWQDENGDGVPQWEECGVRNGAFESLQWALRIGDDLAFYWIENKDTLVRLAPSAWSKSGEPRYDLRTAQKVLPEDVLRRGSWLMAVTPLGPDRLLINHKPLECVEPITGKLLWSYRNDWPSNGHDSPLPVSGQLQHTLNIEGVVDLGGEVGPVFSLNGNKGWRHLLTVDGLYIGPIFRDTRQAPGLAIPEVAPGQDLAGYSLNDEAFLGSFQRGSDGEIYLTGGKCHHTLYRIRGLETIRRFKTTFALAPESVRAAEAYALAREARQRQTRLTAAQASVALAKTPPPLADRPQNWSAAPALAVQQQDKPLFEARLQHDRDNLYLNVRVWDASPFVNSGEDPKLLFKTGDSVNLELGAMRESLKDPAPVPGDIRVLIAPYRGKPVVVVYRYKVAGMAKPVAFRSPAREVLVDQVEVLDSLPVKVQPVSGGYILFAALPKALLGLPAGVTGPRFGDLGVVFSDPAGAVNSYVCFWASPAKGITADVPGEIMLRPQYWKPLLFE